MSDSGPKTSLRNVLRPAPPRLPSAARIDVAAVAMAMADCDRVLVMDGDRLIGAVSEADLLRRMCEPAGRHRTLREIAGGHVATLEASATVGDAVAAFCRGADRTLIVTDGGRVVGCVRPRDVLPDRRKVAAGRPATAPLLASSERPPLTPCSANSPHDTAVR